MSAIISEPAAGTEPAALVPQRGGFFRTLLKERKAAAIGLGNGKTDWVENVLAAGEADVHFIRKDVHITNPRLVPAGGDGEGLPWLARVQVGRLGVLVADIT